MSLVKPKVVMVGPDLDMQGGIASVAKGLIGGGLSERCDLRYIATACEGSTFEKGLEYLRGLKEFRKVVRAMDIVHIHVSVRGSFRRKYEIAKQAKSMGKKLVLHEHSGEFIEIFESENNSYRSKVREFFGWADKVIVLSEEWCDYFAANICEPSKIVIIHNAVIIPDEPVDVRSNPNILFLGRLGARKSPDILLRAAERLQEQFPTVRYRFAGDGDVDKYKMLARNLGVFDQCDFLGWVSGLEKDRLIRKSGIFCLPSRHEGMPMGLLEMMSYGMACVATPVGGISHVIKNGKNGVLVPVGDFEALAESLSLLLSSPALRVRIGKEARKSVESGYDVHTSVDRLLDLYLNLVAVRGVLNHE